MIRKFLSRSLLGGLLGLVLVFFLLVRLRGEVGPSSSVPVPSPLPSISSPDLGPPPDSAPGVAESRSASNRELEFQALLSQVREELPSRGTFREMGTGAVHSLPEAIARAAVSLGRVAQAVANDPSLQPQAAEFYRRCALGDHPNTITAFCLARARRMSPNGQEPAWALSLPEGVRELSRQVKLED